MQRSLETGSSLIRWRQGFYGRFNSGLGGLFSLAMDSWAFLDELVCLSLIGGGETILRAFCSSALWQIYQNLNLLFRVQECSALHGGWDTHSSALGLQTQHWELHKQQAFIRERRPVKVTLGHQSNTLRGARARLSRKLEILNILRWKKGGWRGMGIR
jgi:hypothetical protein